MLVDSAGSLLGRDLDLTQQEIYERDVADSVKAILEREFNQDSELTSREISDGVDELFEREPFFFAGALLRGVGKL